MSIPTQSAPAFQLTYSSLSLGPNFRLAWTLNSFVRYLWSDFPPTALSNKHILGNEVIRTRVLEGLDTGGWRSDRRCLPGTRTRYINRIREWIRNPEGPALCWLNGIAGAGKSSISHELAATLHAKRRPYSCFFFRQDDGTMALSAIRLLAYGLSFVSGLRELIIQAMEQSNDTRVNLTMGEQFTTFIVTPLQEFASICPLRTVVLVIDGVDECPADIRPSFLSAISAGVPLLPSTVKVYLTSRPRVDVHQCLEALKPLNIPVTVGVGMDDGDIEYYLQHELEKISKAAGLEKTWSASQIKRDASVLASKAGGVFQWAWLLSSLLVNRVQPRDMVTRMLDVETSSTPEVNLDVMYTEALNIALPEVSSDVNLGPLYHQVVGTVLAAKQPLTLSGICFLLKADSDDARGAIQALLVNLGSVLVLQHIRGGALMVRVAHPSFRDYVTSQERCPPSWFIEPHQASVQLGSRCFSSMARSLRRDICRMGSPSVTNKDVSSGTIYQYIVTGLQYACLHAFTHVEPNGDNLRMLETFLMEKLLEWLEAMTLMGFLDTAVELMQHALAVLNQVCRALTSFSATYLHSSSLCASAKSYIRV
jgi:NACHT domain